MPRMGRAGQRNEGSGKGPLVERFGRQAANFSGNCLTIMSASADEIIPM